MTLSDKDIQLAMHHCDVVRKTHPVRFLQVLPDPANPYNVRLRYRMGEWQTLHWTRALDFTRTARREQINKRKKAPLPRKAYQAAYAAKRRKQIRQQHQRKLEHMLGVREGALDRKVEQTLHEMRTIIDQYNQSTKGDPS